MMDNTVWDDMGSDFQSGPFSRPKLGTEVTRYLRDAILTGEFRPGQKLAVEALAHQLGISTMPVREALVALASEGIIEALPRRGFRVSEVRRRDIEDVFRVHAYVAGLLAEAAAQSISKEDIATLHQVQAEITEIATKTDLDADRSDRIEALNFEFHSTINRSVEARRLRWFLRAATRFVPRHFYESIPGWIQASVDDHPGIIAALEERDGSRARELTAAHVLHAGELAVIHLASRGFWTQFDPEDRRLSSASERADAVE
jgi:DNA-binding GntR family transcriptional regulator